MNVKALRVKLVENGLNVASLAKKTGIPVSTIYNKINGKSEFTYSEIQKLADTLKLTSEEFTTIFNFKL